MFNNHQSSQIPGQMHPVMKRMTVNEEDVLNQESDDAMMFSPPTMQSPKTKKR